MRLAMSILVRDEADIIEANVRYHAACGVSRFIVTDNGSVDGTREILEKLSKEFTLSVIDEPSMTIDQDLWVTRMAKVLAEENTSDWVINNDADEFWIPQHDELLTDTIERHLKQSPQHGERVGVLCCPRFNIVPSQQVVGRQGYSFRNNRYKVLKDWTDASQMLDLDEDTAALMPDGQHVIIRVLSGKVITRLDGLASVDMGNHGAEHELETVYIDDIEIAHYPIRGFAQFERKVINYGSSMENNDRFGPMISLHLRRWYASYRKGALRQEYDAIVLSDARLSHLVLEGILEVTDIGVIDHNPNQGRPHKAA